MHQKGLDSDLKFLEENEELAKRLANRAGYWYSLKGLEIPETINKGAQGIVRTMWKNIGVAPCYYSYKLELLLEKKDDENVKHIQPLKESDNRIWMPDEITTETCKFSIPESLDEGVYKVKIGLFEEREGQRKPIDIALKDQLKDKDGYFEVSYIEIK